MKNFTLTLLVAAAMIGFSMSANAQTSSGSIGTNATVITPIKVVGDTPLNFGDIVGTSAGGTVTVGTDGTRSAVGAGLLMTNQTGTVTAAQFTVTGQAGYAYSLALPTGAFTIGNGGATPATMSVGTFTSNETGTLTGGSEIVKVGANLTVGANQAAGSYTDASGLTVTVQYN